MTTELCESGDTPAIETADDALALLSDQEQKVALWKTLPVTKRSDEDHVSANDLADDMGVHVATVYRISKRPQVELAARMLLAQHIETEKIAKLWASVFKQADGDGKFALTLIKELHSMGINVLMPEAPAQKGSDSEKGKIELTVPGGFEAAIGVRQQQ